MKQISEHNLLSAQFLLFFRLDDRNADTRWYFTARCCIFRISECTFRDIYHYLHAVISYEPSFDPLSSRDPRIDLTRPYYDQGQWFHLDQPIENHVYSVHGTLRFYHKSFYDFLRDPTRSGAFCVSTPASYCKLLDHFIQDHHHYASSYDIDNSSMYLLPLYPSQTYLLFQTLCRHRVPSAPLLHSLGLMEPSLLTLTLSWRLLPTSHFICGVMTHTFVNYSRMFHSMFCSN